jgi:GDP/UDP-N,N'-diacetylbacillosamine 2-epimerase (hydrolysing)
VFLVGGLGIDNINSLKLLDRYELELSLDFKLGQKSLLITFHPVTLEASTAVEQMTELPTALSALNDTQLIFTLPNADTDSRALIKMVTQFVSAHPNSRAYPSLGQIRYLSCIAQVDGVVGNSSSGLMEVPSFKKGTVNIGDRQPGRLLAASIINCEPSIIGIETALRKLYSAEFQQTLPQVVNPYGEGGAAAKVVDILKSQTLNDIVKKTFHNLPILQIAGANK